VGEESNVESEKNINRDRIVDLHPLTEISSYALLLLAYGLLIASFNIIYPGVIALLFISIALFIIQPGGITVEREFSHSQCRVGEEITITTKIKVEKGLGLIVVREDVPGAFVLKKGSNIHIFFKGLRRLEARYTYILKAVLKGEHRFPGLRVESIHPLFAKESTIHVIEDEKVVKVLPIIYPLRRLRTPRTRSKMVIPLTSVSRLGPQTTDFAEIRTYVYGDPIKFINWKATARSGSRVPLVNRYEREGKKTVMIILDATQNMNMGTNIYNSIEYGVAATASLSYFFLKKGLNVSLYVPGYEYFIPPLTGLRQFIIILKQLMNVNNGVGSVHDIGNVTKYRRYLVEYVPLIVMLTNVSPQIYTPVANLVKTYSGLIKSSRTQGVPMILVDVFPFKLEFEDYTGLALKVYKVEKELVYKKLASLGIYVIPWDFYSQSFSRVMGLLARLVK